MAHLAEKLKQQGNELFKAGDYAAAEEQYTAAITKFSRNPLLFTNRALARIRLQRWQGVIDDCLHSISLTPHNGFNFKSYFYLAQAQLALHHPNEALTSALTAYNQAMNPPPAEANKATAALPSLSELVLKCKKEKFAARERDRRRKRGDVLAELEESLELNKRNELQDIENALANSSIGVVEAQERRQEILDTHQKKVDELKTVFALADPENHQPREVPDYLVDTISFEIMHGMWDQGTNSIGQLPSDDPNSHQVAFRLLMCHFHARNMLIVLDPVTTRTGHSYERATLLEHLKNNPTDPLTREPLTAKDLRPNVALRQVLEEFWKTAGTWAIDW